MKDRKSNIVLIGMPGCGKSTIGVLLAKRLKRLFLDTDVLIQVSCEQSLRELIAERGMDGFRQVEEDYTRCLDVKRAVIATGGSVVYYDSSMTNFKQDGTVVYLKLPLEQLDKRLSDLGERGVVIEPGQTLAALYERRTPLYERWADICIDLSGMNHEAAVRAVIDSLGCQ